MSSVKVMRRAGPGRRQRRRCAPSSARDGARAGVGRGRCWPPAATPPRGRAGRRAARACRWPRGPPAAAGSGRRPAAPAMPKSMRMPSTDVAAVDRAGAVPSGRRVSCQLPGLRRVLAQVVVAGDAGRWRSTIVQRHAADRLRRRRRVHWRHWAGPAAGPSANSALPAPCPSGGCRSRPRRCCSLTAAPTAAASGRCRLRASTRSWFWKRSSPAIEPPPRLSSSSCARAALLDRSPTARARRIGGVGHHHAARRPRCPAPGAGRRPMKTPTVPSSAVDAC